MRSVVAVLALAACGSAHVITRDDYGGTLQLEGNHDKALEEARQLMVEHCGDHNFAIQKEGEEELVNETYTTKDPQTGEPTEHTLKVRVYRVKYVCGSPGK
jgi:hypothetical protein